MSTKAGGASSSSLPSLSYQMRVPRALDPLSHLQDQLDHLVRLIDADVGVHALGRRELPTAAVQRLEAEPGHDGRGEGVVGPGRMEEDLLVPGLVEEPPELVGRDLGSGGANSLLTGLGGIGRPWWTPGRSQSPLMGLLRGQSHRAARQNGAGAAATDSL